MYDQYIDFPKEYYRLWWEYLRRSERYKDFCLKFGTPEQISDPDLDYTFNECGDIHRLPLNDFENWYEFKTAIKKAEFEKESYTWCPPFNKPPAKKNEVIKDTTSVINLAQEYVLESVQEAGDRLRSKLKREPSLQEFQNYYSSGEGVYRDFGYRAFVVEPVLGRNNKETTKDMNKFLINKNPPLSDPGILPPLRKESIRYDELQIYLDVYDLFLKGKNVHEVIYAHEVMVNGKSKYNPKIASLKESKIEGADSLRRKYNRYKTKADLIIGYTEKNEFPGEYKKIDPSL